MTDVAEPMTAKATAYVGYHRSAQATDRLRRRYARERRFKLYGLAAVLIALAMLAFILIDIVGKGYTAFVQTKVELEVYFDPAELDAGDDRSALMRSEEHTSELQSLMRISYAVFCLKKKTTQNHARTQT